jgi:hypothetical protein
MLPLFAALWLLPSTHCIPAFLPFLLTVGGLPKLGYQEKTTWILKIVALAGIIPLPLDP